MKEIYVLVRNLVLVLIISCLTEIHCGDNDYNIIHKDGSYEFGGDSPDSYHYADANRNNVVRGEFGGRNPKTGNIDRTVYTAGPRGFRPRGKNVVRNYDLGQSGARPVGSPDDSYYDPYEDPSYQFGFRTRTQSRQENANRVGDVTGSYSYVDDVGEKHNVEYIAGKRTGFHVKTPFPDSNPNAYGPLYFRGRGRPIPRGRTSIQRGLDGSYRFVSAGPDQRRTEVSDATGHVRGSYTYLDEKGVQHAVHYIAGPETGYRVLKNVRGPHLPTVFPFGRPDIVSPDFYYDFNKDVADVGDVFGTGGGSTKPGSGRPSGGSLGGGVDVGKEDYDTGVSKPGSRPTGGGGDGYDDDYDLFGEGGKPKPGGSSTPRPSGASGGGYPSSTTPGYDGVSSTPGYGSSSTPGYGGTSTTPSYGTPSGTYPGDSGKPQTPLSEYGPPGFGKPEESRPGGFWGKPDGSKPDSNEIDDDFGLFGKPKPTSKPINYPGPTLQVGGGFGPDGRPCGKCVGTVVTNLGDRTFTVPPGVSVRAHVQAIDLVPYESKIPSPSARMREELNAEEDTVVDSRNKSEQIAISTTIRADSSESTTTSTS